MKDKLRELVGEMRNDLCGDFAQKLEAILDADGDGDGDGGAVGVRMSDELRTFIEGMSVSVDVSTGDADAGHRYFGTVTEVMDCDGDKHGVTLLVQDAEANFKPSPVVAIGFRHRMKGSGPEWSYNYHRAPDSFELRECEIETVWSGSTHPARSGVVAHVPVHPRSGPLWMDTYAAGTNPDRAKYPVMDLFSRAPAQAAQVDVDMVERACVAHYESWSVFHQFERESFRRDMKRALTAALQEKGNVRE